MQLNEYCNSNSCAWSKMKLYPTHNIKVICKGSNENKPEVVKRVLLQCVWLLLWITSIDLWSEQLASMFCSLRSEQCLCATHGNQCYLLLVWSYNLPFPANVRLLVRKNKKMEDCIDYTFKYRIMIMDVGSGLTRWVIIIYSAPKVTLLTNIWKHTSY